MDSGETAAVEAAERAVGQVAAGVGPEEAWPGGSIVAVVAPAGKPAAFERAVPHAEDAEADAAAGVVHIGTGEAVVGPVAVASAYQPLLAGYRWVDWAYRHS